MSFLRLGVACVVLDEQGRVLLSKRGDFGTWNLPTGRLDKGEWIAEGALRETWEETGIRAEIVRPVGLYFQLGRERMNVVYLARAIGGDLKQQTSETTENRFFEVNDLPSSLFGEYMIRDAMSGGVHLHTLETPPDKLSQLKRQLAWRWVKNLLAGHPEPRWARFGVQASLAVVDSTTGKLLSEMYRTGERVLPGLNVTGKTPLWEQVRHYTRDTYGVYELREATLAWAGLFQNKHTGAFEFVFKAEIEPHSQVKGQNVAWVEADSPQWWQGYQPFVTHVASGRTDIKVIQEEMNTPLT